MSAAALSAFTRRPSGHYTSASEIRTRDIVWRCYIDGALCCTCLSYEDAWEHHGRHGDTIIGGAP